MRRHPQTVTVRTGPKRVIEGKQARFYLINGETGYRTGKPGRKDSALATAGIICIRQTVRQPKSGFQRISQPCCQIIRIRFDDHTINNNFDVMFAFLIQIRNRIQLIKLAINADTRKSPLQIGGQILFIFPFAAPHDRGQQIQPRARFH